MTNEQKLLVVALRFLAAVVLAIVLSVPLSLALSLAGLKVPLLLGYILPFFFAVTAEGALAVPASAVGIATLIQCAVACFAYVVWLHRARAEKSTVANALAAVAIMAFVNFLWMSALGFSVAAHPVNLRT